MLTRPNWLNFIRDDLKASITVFLVALPLCLGISLASNVPLYSGLISGIIGGVVISLISRSELSVSGPAAGLTTITAAAILDLGSFEIFLLALCLAGILQALLGVARLGGFTHFIPSSVIKGMLAAIGILLIAKQVPLILGYDQPGFWTKEIFSIVTFNHSFHHLRRVYDELSWGAVFLSAFVFVILVVWKKYVSKKISFIPASFVAVLAGSLLAIFMQDTGPTLGLLREQFVNIPQDFFGSIRTPDWSVLWKRADVWTQALIICLVASLETLLSISAIDKLDPFNRVTPQNRELVAQGCGNFVSGLVGGLPITAVIVRSSANAEAGAKTRLSAFAHGIWILLSITLAVPVLNKIPLCVLSVILLRTGYNLAKPKMFRSVFKQGREQFMPFIVTVVAILFTDLLIGVGIGCVYAIYFLIKHTYRAGFVVESKEIEGRMHYEIELALNVAFLNKKRLTDLLDKIPVNSVVRVDGKDSVYIDMDVLEIFSDFRAKAAFRNIDLTMINIPEVETIELH